MALKKYLLIAFTISAGVAFGVFLFAPVSKTLYIKNSDSFLASAENKIGDLSNTIIPSINVPKNITENFASELTQKVIAQNSDPYTPKLISTDGSMSVPDANSMAEAFITNGLKQANENILNIKEPNLKISYDNSKTAIENYLSEAQIILNNNLKTGVSLMSILDEINKNSGAGLEKLLPVIAAHEAAASQLEEISVPSSLKDLITEEIRLLRITANTLRALTGIESDPLGALTAIKQFEEVLQSWRDIQSKFDALIQKLNKIQ